MTRSGDMQTFLVRLQRDGAIVEACRPAVSRTMLDSVTRTPGDSMDIVYIRDLKIETVIGIFDWERRIRQTVSIDLEMATDIRKAQAAPV